MNNLKINYLSLNGIPVETLDNKDIVYFFLNSQGAWLPTIGNLLYEIESECIKIHDALAESIFGDYQSYYNFLRVSPQFLSEAGMNSESLLSKNGFSKLLENFGGFQGNNQALYLYDCRKLVSSIQECNKEVMYLQGEFYRALNLEELFFPPIEKVDGTRYITSPVVTNIHATLGFIFIRLHSLLDYITKLSIEVEKLKNGFSSYPQLVSKNAKYSDRKSISFNKTPNTLFEKCKLLTEIETVRNHVIHDGLIDDMPKAYTLISSGKIIEKFILFPDCCSEGRFETFKNRNLFYSKEDKINLRLPHLINDFQHRLLITLKKVLITLQEKSLNQHTTT